MIQTEDNCPLAPDFPFLPISSPGLNHSFILEQIRKYNQARRLIYRDRALLAIGLHTGFLKKSHALAPELSQEERERVLYFCRQFLKANAIQAELKE